MWWLGGVQDFSEGGNYRCGENIKRTELEVDPKDVAKFHKLMIEL